jgi:proteasome accessory factor B
MPKETFISRFSLILRRLEKGPATYEQIARYLEDESAIQDKDFSISRRTLQRDIRDIYSQLNIEIVNEKKGDKRYFIKNPAETVEYGQRLLESYQIVHAINAAQEFSNIVFLESRKPKGLDHFYGLLHAIRNKRVLSFQHFKFPDGNHSKRTVHPLGLKESQGRWYLVAVDTKDKVLKTFGLDRIEDLDISKTRFRETQVFNLPHFFAHSFGITRSNDTKPELIRLCFSYDQAEYIKAFPLHVSQKTIEENEKHLIIEIHVYITYDLIKELISYGADLEVLSPVTLRNEIKKSLTKTLSLYQLP